MKKSVDKAPFCFSGTKVMDGEAQLVVLAVGVDSQWGILQMSLRGKMKESGDDTWPHNRRWYGNSCAYHRVSRVVCSLFRL